MPDVPLPQHRSAPYWLTMLPNDSAANFDTKQKIDTGEPAAATSGRTYENPILNADFPDPAVIHAGDGFYYAYATQSRPGDHWVNIQVARSPDLIHWDFLGDALPQKPAWAQETQDFWAPYVLHDGDRYLMYYSAKPDGCGERHDHALAIAVADKPEGPFVDTGQPLLVGEGFEYIDPMVFDDPATGKRLLYWGSGFKPIKVQEMTPDGLAFAPGSKPTDIIWPSGDGSFPRLVEAAWVTYRDGIYYIFYSGDNCCGPQAEYGVMVARSTSAMGPFESLEKARGIPHSLMLYKSDRWLAPGHNSIAIDKAGNHWIIYHAVDVNHPRQRQEDEINSRRILLIDKIEWTDGWPFVGAPSEGPQAAPVT